MSFASPNAPDIFDCCLIPPRLFLPSILVFWFTFPPPRLNLDGPSVFLLTGSAVSGRFSVSAFECLEFLKFYERRFSTIIKMKNRRLILRFARARENNDGLHLNQNATFKFVSRPSSFRYAFIPATKNLTEIHVYGWTRSLCPSTLYLLEAAFITMFYCMLKLWKSQRTLAGHSCSANWRDFKSIKSQEIKSNFWSWWEGRVGVPGEKPLGGQYRTNKTQPTYGVEAEIAVACTTGVVTTQRARLFHSFRVSRALPQNSNEHPNNACCAG